MKKLFTLFALLAMSIVSIAQTHNVYEWKDGVVSVRNFSEIDSLTFRLSPELFSLTTVDITEKTANSFSVVFGVQSRVSINNSVNISEQGICYSTNPVPPTYNDMKVKFGTFTPGYCSVTLSNLAPSTTYYIRSYLKISNEIIYEDTYYEVTTLAGSEEWKSLGMGKFMDAFLYDDKTYFDVEIQQNYNEPNRFRVVDPYVGILGSIPVDKYLEFSILPAGSEFKEYVTDAEYVIFNDYNMGQWNSNYPEDIFLIHPYRFGMDLSLWKYNKVLDYQSNGLPGEVSIAPYYFLFNVGGGWNQTKETTISILFPGYRKRDYSSSVEFEGTFKAENGTTYAVGNLTLGGDATDVKAVVMPADADAKAVADAIAAGEVQATDVSSGRIEVPFDAEELGSEKLQIIVAVIANNVVKSFDNASFDYYGEGGSPWKSLGTGYYTDDILGSMWRLPPTTYEVEILEHTENPGLYRLVNPYNNKVYPAEYAELFASQLGNSLAPEGYTLEVNATDPEGVYIQKQTLGLDFGDGEWAFETEGSRYLSNYDIVMLKEAGYMGAVMDGVIRFPAFSFNASDGSKRAYQGILYEGGSGYYSATNAQLEIVLPSANAFARNMAVAKAKTTQRTALKKSFSGVKVDVKMKKLFLDSNIEKMEIVKF